MKKEKYWKYHHFNDEEIEAISDKLNTSKTVAKVLISAGFDTDNTANLDRFLSPKIDEILKKSNSKININKLAYKLGPKMKTNPKTAPRVGTFSTCIVS